MKRIVLLLFLVSLLCSGCATKWTADTFTLNDDPAFDVKVTTEDCMSYNLTVTNKTAQDFEILWGKTYYIDESNTTNGGFMFGNETDYEQTDKSRATSVVFGKDSLTKALYPAAIAYWKRGWNFSYLPAGKTGIYLTIKSGQEEIKRRLYVNVNY